MDPLVIAAIKRKLPPDQAEKSILEYQTYLEVNEQMLRDLTRANIDRFASGGDTDVSEE